MSKVRVRFAPSPTGLLHLGSLRTALFTWLYARQQKGRFILRFEDTDRDRLVPKAIPYTQEALRWLGLDWDEGPLVQSQRLKLYRDHAEKLVEQGRAYRDWTPEKDLEAMRKIAQAAGVAFKVDREQLKTGGQLDQPHVIRFAIDPKFNPVWHDMVRGKLSQKGSELDDFVAIKSDGYPTYNFANVVDDHQMEISHVIRGEEFIASTPKFLQLYKALGWTPPQFAHLPPVLGSDKSKLSKRHGAEAALVYRDKGYLPEAITNFLALLGWNDGTEKEIFSPAELITAFSLDRVQRSPAVFDPERLNWFNGIYIRQLSVDQLLERAKGFWPPAAKRFDGQYKKRVLALVQERLKYLAELADLTDFFFTDPTIDRKLLPKVSKDHLHQARKVLAASTFSEADLEQRLRKLVEDLDTKPGKLFQSIRVAITGETAAPGLFETLAVIGKKRSQERLDRALKKL